MKVVLHRDAEKYLDRIPEPAKSHVEDALYDLEEEPPKGDIRPLAGQQDTFRLKIGGYRIIFRCKNDSIYVTHIDPRGQAYKKKNRGNKR